MIGARRRTRSRVQRSHARAVVPTLWRERGRRSIVPRVTRASLLVRTLVLGAVGAASLVVACGGSSDGNAGSSGSPVGDAGKDRRLPGPVHPAASCPVTLESPDTSGGG